MSGSPSPSKFSLGLRDRCLILPICTNWFMTDQHPGRKRFTSTHGLYVVDIASRFKSAEPLTLKDSLEVSNAFQKMYWKGPMRWPKVLQVDPGREFMGEVTKEKAKNDVRVRRENVNVHRDQGIVERFTRTLSERLFSYQYSQEMNFRSAERSREWVKSLPKVFLALNGEKTRLTGKKPVEAIKEKLSPRKVQPLKARGYKREETRFFCQRKISLCPWRA